MKYLFTYDVHVNLFNSFAQHCIFYSARLLTFLDIPTFNGGSVNIEPLSDSTVITWAAPVGFFTRITMKQCFVNTTCVQDHVISAGVNELSVRESDGTEMTLMLWQDRDAVLSYSFTLTAASKSTFVPPFIM